MQETKEELFTRHRDWETAKANYEARLKTLTEGNATAQKVEQLEQRLNRAVELLKTVNADKQNLGAKVTALEESIKEAEARAMVAEETVTKQKQELEVASAPVIDQDSAKLKELEAQLQEEQEQHSFLVESLRTQLSESVEANKALKASLEEQANHHKEESNGQADILIQLEMTKDELEQANQEISTLKEVNAKLVLKAKSGATPSQPSPAHDNELADAKHTIAGLKERLSAESKHGDEVKALKATQGELEATIKAANTELTEIKAKYAESQAELAQTKDAHAALKKNSETAKGMCNQRLNQD